MPSIHTTHSYNKAWLYSWMNYHIINHEVVGREIHGITLLILYLHDFFFNRIFLLILAVEFAQKLTILLKILQCFKCHFISRWDQIQLFCIYVHCVHIFSSLYILSQIIWRNIGRSKLHSIHSMYVTDTFMVYCHNFWR